MRNLLVIGSVAICLLLSGCFSFISRSYTVEYQRHHFVYKPNRSHRLQRKCDRKEFDARIDTTVFYEIKGALIKFFDNGRFMDFIGYPRIRYTAVENADKSVYEYPNELVNDLNQYTLGWYYVKGDTIYCSYFRYGLFGPIMERFKIKIDANRKLIHCFNKVWIDGNKEEMYREVRVPNCIIHSSDANW